MKIDELDFKPVLDADGNLKQQRNTNAHLQWPLNKPAHWIIWPRLWGAIIIISTAFLYAFRAHPIVFDQTIGIDTPMEAVCTGIFIMIFSIGIALGSTAFSSDQ